MKKFDSHQYGQLSHVHYVIASVFLIGLCKLHEECVWVIHMFYKSLFLPVLSHIDILVI